MPFTKQLIHFLHKSFGRVPFTLKAALLSLCCTFFISCSKGSQPIVIWTNLPDFASYAELFNATNDKQQVLVVYKADPQSSLPPADNELVPDIIISSWLKNSTTKKNFKAIDSLFNNDINEDDFYEELLNYGKVNERQYLLPVSFNLPMMILAKNNEDLVPTSHLITLEQIRDTSKEFNTKNKYDEYASMGYAPSWDKDFIYETTKLMGADYIESAKDFSWNQNALTNSIIFLRDWTTNYNTNSASEQNFQFKYLFSAKYKQVTSGRCLFAYSTSDIFFTLGDEQASSLSFRWIAQNGKIPVEDNIVYMGIYKYAKHTKGAKNFISWFEDYDTQKQLMERTKEMNLDTKNFGIARGFSAIKNVNEKIYPIYYRHLLENLPGKDYLKTPNSLPFYWSDLRENVIEPFLSENTNSAIELLQAKTLEDALLEWNKQYF